MRFVVRLLGTWLLGLALILLIVDGTKSLAANALVLTSVSELWSLAHSTSLARFEQLVLNGPAALIWPMVFEPALGWPAWAICGVPGLLFTYLGRTKGTRIRNLNGV